MTRFLMSVGVAAVTFALVAVPQTRADNRQGGRYGSMSRGHMSSNRGEYRHGSGHHFDYRFPTHGYNASHRFGYERYGYRSLRYNHYRWSSDYRCYLYWAPSYRCWFFYEPTYSYYVPVTYYRQVYPQAPASVAVVPPPPSVIQQTTVVVPPTTPTGPIAEVAPPAPVGPVPPPPTAVQNTKVGPGAP